MAEKKKGNKINAAKAGRLKGRNPLQPPKGKVVRQFEKPNQDIITKADVSLRSLMENKGIPRYKVGLK